MNKEKNKQERKDMARFFLTFRYGWFLTIGFFLGFFIYGLITLFLGLNIILLISQAIGAIIIMFSFIFMGGSLVNTIMKKSLLKKIEKIHNINNPKAVVILGFDGWQGMFVSSYLGVNYLLKYLELKKQSYNLYLTPSKKKFNNILSNANTTILYLIGHGSKRGFRVNKTENIFYSDYLNSKICKDEIHLYHCGHSEGNTIIDYLVKEKDRKKCFVANDKIMVISYILRLHDLYKRELQKSKKGESVK